MSEASGNTNALDLSLILPCYNEHPVFETSTRSILKTLSHTTFSYEIIFVDDCSRDDTRALIDALIAAHPDKNLVRIFHEQNKGRGGAVADGLRAARGQVAGYIDIDLEVGAEYIPALTLAVQDGADIALGQRNYLFQPRSLDRWILSKGYHRIAKAMLGFDSFWDTESGYKFFNRVRILQILDEIQDQRWFWDTEVMVRAAVHGYRIVEVPVLFLRNYGKQSSVNALQDTMDYFQRLWQFRATVRELKARQTQ